MKNKFLKLHHSIFQTLILIFVLTGTVTSNAKGPQLRLLHPNEAGLENPHGFDILLDQIFRVSGEKFENKIIFFADTSVSSSTSESLPSIFIAQDKKILTQAALPQLLPGYHLEEVKALMIDSKKTDDKKMRLLALMTFEPPAGPVNAWDQAFAIDISADDKITFDEDLNKKLADHVTSKTNRFKTIKDVKKFVDK